MTDKRHPDEDWQALAGQFALRLLTGEELERARSLSMNDPDFAREAARWQGRLAPLARDVEPSEPPSAVWARIDAETAGPNRDSNVLLFRRQVNAWRGATAAMTAIAASLAGVLLLQPTPTAPPVVQAPPASPMVAMLGDRQKQMKVMASWDPTARQLVLAVAGDMPSDPRHSHELWVIPAGGKPRSLGTMGRARQAHMKLAEAIADLMQNGATVAISVEPQGGSPTGLPTGPVVASGALTRA